jgi:predicted MPP superfamily phosphohydrolase
VPTIEAHLSLMRTHGYVWWAWFKKEAELPRYDVLQAFLNQLPTEVGLVNRKTGELYRARCDAIEWDESGDRGSPEPSKTPSYYPKGEYPAWFRLSEIHAISLERWKATFNEVGVPLGEPSIFWVEQGSPGEQHPPPPNILTRPTSSSTVLHLSDLHFGEFHGYRVGESGGVLAPPTMVDRVVDAVEAAQANIGIVVISGDLICRGNHGDYGAVVRPQVERLLERLEVRKEQVVLIPGNHDILLTEADEDFRQEVHFKEFLRSFFASDIEQIESGARYESDDDWTLTFINLNSARPRKLERAEYGYVGRRADPFLMELTEADRIGRGTTFAVVHHHLMPVEREVAPPPERPVSIMLDAGALIEDFQQAGVHCVLHGHQHDTAISSCQRGRREESAWTGLDGPSLWVISGGSCGASEEYLPEGLKFNTIGIYEPDVTGLRVRTVQYIGNQKPSIRFDTVLPLPTRDSS